jgi:hypothetical protein
LLQASSLLNSRFCNAASVIFFAIYFSSVTAPDQLYVWKILHGQSLHVAQNAFGLTTRASEMWNPPSPAIVPGALAAPGQGDLPFAAVPQLERRVLLSQTVMSALAAAPR